MSSPNTLNDISFPGHLWQARADHANWGWPAALSLLQFGFPHLCVISAARLCGIPAQARFGAPFGRWLTEYSLNVIREWNHVPSKTVVSGGRTAKPWAWAQDSAGLREETIAPMAANPSTHSAPTSLEADWARRRQRKRTTNAIRTLLRLGWNLLPLLTFVAMVGIWAGAIRVFAIPSYLLPGPAGVFHVLISEPGMLWDNAKTTLAEILLGFGLTLLSAIPLGLVIALSPLAKQVLYPPAMLLQLLPKVAVAPLFLVWFGFGIESKVILTLLMTFFPLLIASISGFQILDTRLLYLTRSMGATTWQTFRYLRVPAALPVIFSGVRTSATIAATAAIVAEFVGANKGLGYVLLKGTSTMNIQLTFAVLVILTVIGLAINYAVEFSEWILAPWQRSSK